MIYILQFYTNYVISLNTVVIFRTVICNVVPPRVCNQVNCGRLRIWLVIKRQDTMTGYPKANIRVWLERQRKNSPRVEYCYCWTFNRPMSIIHDFCTYIPGVFKLQFQKLSEPKVEKFWENFLFYVWNNTSILRPSNEYYFTHFI